MAVVTARAGGARSGSGAPADYPTALRAWSVAAARVQAADAGGMVESAGVSVSGGGSGTTGVPMQTQGSAPPPLHTVMASLRTLQLQFAAELVEREVREQENARLASPSLAEHFRDLAAVYGPAMARSLLLTRPTEADVDRLLESTHMPAVRLGRSRPLGVSTSVMMGVAGDNATSDGSGDSDSDGSESMANPASYAAAPPSRGAPPHRGRRLVPPAADAGGGTSTGTGSVTAPVRPTATEMARAEAEATAAAWASTAAYNAMRATAAAASSGRRGGDDASGSVRKRKGKRKRRGKGTKGGAKAVDSAEHSLTLARAFLGDAGGPAPLPATRRAGALAAAGKEAVGGSLARPGGGAAAARPAGPGPGPAMQRADTLLWQRIAVPPAAAAAPPGRAGGPGPGLGVRGVHM